MEHSLLFSTRHTETQHNPFKKWNKGIWASVVQLFVKMRHIESVKTEKFKLELDKFLELIPDEPKMPNYVTAAGSNSILDQLTNLRAQGIYHGGGVLDSATEQYHSKYPSIQASTAR